MIRVIILAVGTVFYLLNAHGVETAEPNMTKEVEVVQSQEELKESIKSIKSKLKVLRSTGYYNAGDGLMKASSVSDVVAVRKTLRSELREKRKALRALKAEEKTEAQEAK